MKNEYPLISIIVPMFNTRKYVETCIESILQQTFTDFELIIIDDCSTDGSLEFVLENFSDPRIRVFHLDKNSGAGAAMNHGIDLSRGEYIYIVDSDDAIMPEALQTLLNAAQKFNADVVHMTRFFYAENEDFNFVEPFQANIASEIEPILGLQPIPLHQRVKVWNGDTFFPAWLNLYRAKFIHDKKIRFPEFRDGSYDVFFTLSLLCIAERFVKIDPLIYVYRINSSDSFTNSKAEIKLERFLSSVPVMLKYCRDLFSRDDLLKPIKRVNQLDVMAILIAMIFSNLNVRSIPQEKFSEILSRIAMSPDFYSHEFLKEQMDIFYYLVRLIK